MDRKERWTWNHLMNKGGSKEDLRKRIVELEEALKVCDAIIVALTTKVDSLTDTKIIK